MWNSFVFLPLKKSGQYTSFGLLTHFQRVGYCKRYVSCAIRNAIALLMLIPAFAIGDGANESKSANDFYITVTANHLYLCGEGFGGMYGCIDEAISREAKSVVISASSEATVQAVQALVNAVHAVGFDQVGVATFNEYDT
jgi:hypothetical protein